MMNAFLLWAATFAATFALDITWVFYIRNVEAGRALSSASWAAFLYLTAAAATVSYVQDPWLLIPATAGAFLGTLFGVMRSKRGLD
jgi:hypothetical protein